VNILGFLGDLIGGLIEGVEAPFGQRLKKDDHTLRDLYKHTYFDFGLNSLMNLKDNEIVPMRTKTRAGMLDEFEIRGKILTPARFLSRGWGSPFHTINREIETLNGRVWAFDITRLNESILVGNAVHKDDEVYVRSEEYLKILQAVGGAVTGGLHSVPAIQLDFGEIWSRYGIPDRIFVSLQSTYPLSDHQLQQVVNLILHTYNRGSLPVTADYAKNITDETVTLVMRETKAQPQQEAPSETQQKSEPATTAPSSPSDGFPYDFYRGLGLIDAENMVEVPSILGPMKIHMTEEWAKNHLLAYKP
jgi:hypothetical protein